MFFTLLTATVADVPVANQNWIIVLAIVVIFPTCATILGLLFKRWINNAYRGWEKYEELKEKNITEWRNNYCKKVQEVKDTVDEIQEEMKSKVAILEHKEVKLQVDEQGRKILVLELKVDNIRGGRV